MAPKLAVAVLSCVLAVRGDDPACPDGVCPGLGNLFYLPSVNAKKIVTGGRHFLNNARVGTCAKISASPRSSRKFFEQDNMESLVKSVNTDSQLSGSYPTQALTVKGSVDVLTGSSSESTSKFHSTQLDVTVVTRVVDLEQTDACLASENNFDAGYLARLEALPLISDPAHSSSWAPYVEFLRDQGSHMMMQQAIGSRFQQWESTTSTSSDAADTLKIKACASVEGVEGSSGWSVSACSAYSSSQKREAQKSSSNSLRLILGGTTATRLALTEEMSEANLNSFIASAEQGNHAVAFSFKPVWETLITYYTGRCHATGKAADCENEQRSYNLQAAFEGWLAVGCPEKTTNNGVVYQQMVVSDTHARVKTYQCNAGKTGCYSDDDCHIGGAGSVCYCHGESCLTEGATVPGTSSTRSEVQAEETGSTWHGTNLACYFHFFWHCDCDKGWAGGLAARQLWVQGGKNELSEVNASELLL